MKLARQRAFLFIGIVRLVLIPPNSKATMVGNARKALRASLECRKDERFVRESARDSVCT